MSGKGSPGRGPHVRKHKFSESVERCAFQSGKLKGFPNLKRTGKYKASLFVGLGLRDSLSFCVVFFVFYFQINQRQNNLSLIQMILYGF